MCISQPFMENSKKPGNHTSLSNLPNSNWYLTDDDNYCRVHLIVVQTSLTGHTQKPFVIQ